jgi:molybdenum cofactor cytidylyltransferase
MIFGPRETSKAKGMILADDIAPSEGQVLSKGTVLGPQDIARLIMANIKEITVAELEPHDIDAPGAALKIAQAMVSHPDDSMVRIVVGTRGCVRLVANVAGIVGIDTAALARMNMVEGVISVVTLPQLYRVAKGDDIAVINIVSYGVKRSSVGRVVAEAHDVIYVRGVIARTASLVQTVGHGAPDPRGESEVRMRLDRLGVRLIQSNLVPHNTESLAEAIVGVEGDVLFIMTATPTEDIDDVAPRAVVAAGGVITRFGLPAHPGSQLFAGGLGAMPILGLPDCARDSAYCGADWIIERLLCGVSITDDDVARMSVGGLTQPR